MPELIRQPKATVDRPDLEVRTDDGRTFHIITMDFPTKDEAMMATDIEPTGDTLWSCAVSEIFPASVRGLGASYLPNRDVRHAQPQRAHYQNTEVDAVISAVTNLLYAISEGKV